MKHVVVIGGGVGGLAAAIRLVLDGARVTLCEASPFFGGLASSLQIDGMRFDGGPYILLDPLGLEHAFEGLGMSIGALELQAVDFVYEVDQAGAPSLPVHRNLEQTVDAWERAIPGQGVRYRAFVREMTRVHARLSPLQRQGRPSPGSRRGCPCLDHCDG